eukprot:gene30221-39428_t
MPRPTLLSETTPIKSYDFPSQKINTRRVDSKSEAKSENKSGSMEVPKFIGSTFVHTANAVVRPVIPKPMEPTLPKAYDIPTVEKFSTSPLLKGRTPSGQILGSYSRRYVPAQNVPYMEADNPVGPDNPVKAINDVWSACWDNEAGAVYYYNQSTGEATWIQPAI